MATLPGVLSCTCAKTSVAWCRELHSSEGPKPSFPAAPELQLHAWDVQGLPGAAPEQLRCYVQTRSGHPLLHWHLGLKSYWLGRLRLRCPERCCRCLCRRFQPPQTHSAAHHWV